MTYAPGNTTPQLPYARPAIARIDLLLLTITYLVALLICFVYVSNEHFFYYWDYRGYQERTTELTSALTTSFFKGVRIFFSSLSSDYNKIACLPLLPFFFIFGPGRLAYIAGLTTVYVVPFALVIGAISTQLLRFHRRAVFWSGVWLALALPATWAAALRGHPDIGGGAILGVAAFLFLRDQGLLKWRTVFTVGFLIGFAVLFRRHFAYAAIAALIAIILSNALQRWPRSSPLSQSLPVVLAECAPRWFCLGLTAVLTVTIISPLFAWRAASTDYTQLYSSYVVTPQQAFYSMTLDTYGWLTLSLALLGFILGIIRGALDKRKALFILLFGLLFIIIWMTIPREPGIHYTTPGTLFIAVGLIAFAWTVFPALSQPARRVMLPLAMLVVAAQAILGLSIAGLSERSARLLPQSYPPLRREDYSSIVNLTEFLTGVSANTTHIAVTASSFTLNGDLLKSADWELSPNHAPRLHLLRTPSVDSRDAYPLSDFLKADLVVVGKPFQHHLRAEEQDVVRTMADQFLGGWGIATDFQQLPVVFPLENGVQALVFERKRRPTLPQVLETLERMRKDVGVPPGRDTSWLFIDGNTDNKVEASTLPASATLTAILDPGPASFLYFGRIPENVVIQGTFQSGKCHRFRNLSLAFRLLDGQGRPLGEVVLPVSPRDDIALSQPLPSHGATYLLLAIEGEEIIDPAASCLIKIDEMKVAAP
ncbi:MAG: hypothetical protein U1F76_10870 [Candidatus Competibacteraceae bacterium]